MKTKIEIFLNSSEHIFDLSFSDNLMLCNYARLNSYGFCSMIGGAESIRDLQESKNIFADAFEFPMIESEFAIKKIFAGLNKVFIDDNYSLIDKKIFINISSIDGLTLLKELNNLKIPEFLERSNIIFNFDRRGITKSLGLAKNDNFELFEFEKEINIIIKTHLSFIENSSMKFSISGGITENSIKCLFEDKLFPDFIKTGLFTIEVDSSKDNIYENIYELQSLELKLLNSMNKCIIHKHNYLQIRELHLQKYILN